MEPLDSSLLSGQSATVQLSDVPRSASRGSAESYLRGDKRVARVAQHARTSALEAVHQPVGIGGAGGDADNQGWEDRCAAGAARRRHMDSWLRNAVTQRRHARNTTQPTSKTPAATATARAHRRAAQVVLLRASTRRVISISSSGESASGSSATVSLCLRMNSMQKRFSSGAPKRCACATSVHTFATSTL